MQSIREVIFEEVYRLPDNTGTHVTLIDLGANIGLTSIWLAKRYHFSKIVAVEPDPKNAEILRANLSRNGVDATVIEAAVGPVDGFANFLTSTDSNVGRLADTCDKDMAVKVISMQSLLEQAGIAGDIDLLKLDIEGGEEALATGNLDWMSRIRAIIAELHPTISDTKLVIERFERTGMRFMAASSDQHRGQFMDMFLRDRDENAVYP